MNFTDWLWSEGRGFHNVIRFPFTLLAWIYAAVIRLRLFFYVLGIFQKKTLACRVISVGNITVGGTGKTPMTFYLAEQWRKRGAKVGIVTRGYGRKNKEAVIVVSDGMRVLENAVSVGDEAVLMAKRLGDIPLVVSADRYRGGQLLIQDFKVDLILLDDGFQHLRLQRDQNILLIDASNPFGNNSVLPRGLLREPKSAMRRADCIVITRSDLAKDLPALIRQLGRFGPPVLSSQFQATGLFDLASGLFDVEKGVLHSLDDLKDRPILAFCGIGNPSAFFKQLLNAGAVLKETKVFRDHHNYEAAEVLSVCTRAEEMGVDWVVTTEKDAVKIRALKSLDLENSLKCRLFVLRIGVRFLNPLKEEQLLFSQ